MPDCFSESRLKEISQRYPVFNEKTEEIWGYNAKFDKNLKKPSNEIKVAAMEKNIMNHICVKQRRNGLPHLKTCYHVMKSYKRYMLLKSLLTHALQFNFYIPE